MAEKLAINGGNAVRMASWPRWPQYDTLEENHLLEVFRSGEWWRSFDEQDPSLSRVARFQNDFAHAHDCRYGICTTNGTVSLEIALRAGGVKPGDEVIVPAYTFIATATAPLMIGAIPIFVDMDPDTYTMDIDRVRAAITEKTRAIIPVHFAGQACDMDAINALAQEHDLFVLEDAAHAHGASYKNRACGSLAHAGSFSFQASKNMTAGEGGIITTNDADYAERCETLVWAGRQHGKAWYNHEVLASNARMTEFQGALLSAQLTRLKAQTEKRTLNARYLHEHLSQIEGISPVAVSPNTSVHAYHLYMFRYDASAFSGLSKTAFVNALQAEGITGASAGYVWPIYRNPVFEKKQFLGGSFPVDERIYGKDIDYSAFAAVCPVSERACDSEAVWLPQNLLLAETSDMADIVEAVRKIQALASTVQ